MNGIKEQLEIESLWLEYQKSGDENTRNGLVIHYIQLVKYIVARTINHYQFFNYAEDIINEGLIALIDAIKKFDFDKQVKFETFASIKIRGAIIDYIRKQDCFPRRLKRIAKEINEADNTLAHELGRTPTKEEMANYLKVNLDQYQKMEAETSSLSILSFEELILEKSTDNICENGLISTISGPEQTLAASELKFAIAKGIEQLNKQEQTIISLYYIDELKIKEIASIMEISDSRVSQIHSAALKKLRRQLGDYNN